MFDALGPIMDIEVEKKLGFQKQKLQQFVCAVALTNVNKLGLTVVPSGAGKSYCLMVSANKLVADDPNCNVVILTASEVLVEQLKIMIGRHVD
jgi:superfamily II DNA or RNA helicase